LWRAGVDVNTLSSGQLGYPLPVKLCEVHPCQSLGYHYVVFAESSRPVQRRSKPKVPGVCGSVRHTVSHMTGSRADVSD
jgi:hypothetical protein